MNSGRLPVKTFGFLQSRMKQVQIVNVIWYESDTTEIQNIISLLIFMVYKSA